MGRGPGMAGGKALAGRARAGALKAVRAAMRHEWGRLYFNEPVDAEALGIPEYPEVVKEPMELETVLARLEGDEYCALAEVAHDVNLVRAALTPPPPPPRDS